MLAPVLAAPGDAPQGVIAKRVAAVEVAHAMSTGIGRRQPVRLATLGPSGALEGPDRQRPELIEGEAPVREAAGHLLDPVQLGVEVRIGGGLPGASALEGHAVLVQQPAQVLAPDDDRPLAVADQVLGELAHAPVCKRTPQPSRGRFGRLDDDRDVLITDQARTASRPPRVQRGQPPLVEGMDHTRTVSSCAATSRAIDGAGVPDSDAIMIGAPGTSHACPGERSAATSVPRPHSTAAL